MLTFGRLLETLSYVANANECLKRCKFSVPCKYWDFNVATRQCRLRDRDAIADRKTNTDYFAGPKECEDMKYYGKL